MNIFLNLPGPILGVTGTTSIHCKFVKLYILYRFALVKSTVTDAPAQYRVAANVENTGAAAQCSDYYYTVIMYTFIICDT